jgi:hypothetical protein
MSDGESLDRLETVLCDSARGQQKVLRMGIIDGNQVLGLRIRSNMLSSPSGPVRALSIKL